MTYALEWFEINNDASKDDFVNKQKELQNLISPILMATYQKIQNNTTQSNNKDENKNDNNDDDEKDDEKENE
jgi:hypothetical protein